MARDGSVMAWVKSGFIGVTIMWGALAQGQVNDRWPLLSQATLFGGGQTFLSCRILGEETQCKLDTGANGSSVRESAKNKDLKTVGTSIYTSASGSKVRCRNIILPEFSVGRMTRENFEVVSCPPVDGRTELNILGLDFIGQNSIEINYKNQFLEMNPQRRPEKILQLERGPHGHLLIPLAVGSKESLTQAWGMVDTGAAVSVVSLKFAESLPAVFVPVREEVVGTDTHGNPIRSVLMIFNLRVGETIISAGYVMGIDFSGLHQMLGDRVQFVIGNNLLKEKNWFFDFAAQNWAVY